MLKKSSFAALVIAALTQPAFAASNTLLGSSSDTEDAPYARGKCSIPQSDLNGFQSALNQAVQPSPVSNGGVFSPNMMWLSVVDRKGVVCLVIKSTKGPTPDPWPGSRAIAMAKAYTANAFSNNQKALSTANIYGPTQPGGSLYGLNNSNPFNPLFLGQGTGIGFVAGGIITFGGGVALYKNGTVIGGVGVSGDTSCADHAVVWRVRILTGFNNGIPGGPGADNISYANTGTGFTQPNCLGPSTDVTPSNTVWNQNQ